MWELKEFCIHKYSFRVSFIQPKEDWRNPGKWTNGKYQIYFNIDLKLKQRIEDKTMQTLCVLTK